jgi:hypothetical protein
MRELDNYEISAVSGGIDSGVIGTLVFMGMLIGAPLILAGMTMYWISAGERELTFRKLNGVA